MLALQGMLAVVLMWTCPSTRGPPAAGVRQSTGSRKHLLEGGAAGGGARHGRLRLNRARNAPRHVELVGWVERLAPPADVGRHHQGGRAVCKRNLQGAHLNLSTET